jgi:hypothetical protein
MTNRDYEIVLPDYERSSPKFLAFYDCCITNVGGNGYYGSLAIG